MSNRRYILAIMLTAYALVYFHRTMTGVVKEQVDLLANYYGIDSSLLASAFFSAYFYAYALAQPLTGVLLDTYGAKRICSMFLIAMSISTLMITLPSPITLVLGRAFVGLFATVVFLAAQRSASLLYTSGEQALITGFLLMIGNISTALGTYPLQLFIGRYGFTALFHVLAVLSLILGLAIYVFSSDKGGSEKGLGVLDIYKGLGKAIKDPRAWSIPLTTIAIYDTSLAFQSGWGQVYFREIGFDEQTTGLLLMCTALLFALFTPFMGYLSDRVFKSRKPFLALGSLFSAIAWLIALWGFRVKEMSLTMLFIPVLSIAYSMHTSAVPMIKELYSTDYVAVIVSFHNIVLFTALAILLSISTYLTTDMMCIASIILGVIGAVLSAFFSRESYK
ncbi:MAG: MFS transporter [Desulfurococcaceae archaeon]